MIRLAPRLALVAATAALAMLVGCTDVPSFPTTPNIAGSGPTLRGTVKASTTTNLRVGLLGSTKAGGTTRELVGAPASSGSFSMQLPASPPYDMMLDDNQSVVFTLQAYADKNKNAKYDAGEETDAAAQNGTVRFFAEDGPAGSYKAGWNVFKDGRYSQSFDLAFNVQSLF
jgi:hypothetical protein